MVTLLNGEGEKGKCVFQVFVVNVIANKKMIVHLKKKKKIVLKIIYTI